MQKIVRLLIQILGIWNQQQKIQPRSTFFINWKQSLEECYVLPWKEKSSCIQTACDKPDTDNLALKTV